MKFWSVISSHDLRLARHLQINIEAIIGFSWKLLFARLKAFQTDAKVSLSLLISSQRSRLAIITRETIVIVIFI